MDLEKAVANEFWEKKRKRSCMCRARLVLEKHASFIYGLGFALSIARRVSSSSSSEKKESCLIWIREADGSLFGMEKGVPFYSLRLVVENILQERIKNPSGLCIHDGVLEGKQTCNEMLTLLNDAVSNETIEKVAHITSLAFTLSTGGQCLDEEGEIVRLFLDSWTIENIYSLRLMRSADHSLPIQ